MHTNATSPQMSRLNVTTSSANIASRTRHVSRRYYNSECQLRANRAWVASFPNRRGPLQAASRTPRCKKALRGDQTVKAGRLLWMLWSRWVAVLSVRTKRFHRSVIASTYVWMHGRCRCRVSRMPCHAPRMRPRRMELPAGIGRFLCSDNRFVHSLSGGKPGGKRGRSAAGDGEQNSKSEPGLAHVVPPLGAIVDLKSSCAKRAEPEVLSVSAA